MKPNAPFSFNLRHLIVAVLIFSVLLGLIVHVFLDAQRTVIKKRRSNNMESLVNQFPSVVSNLKGRWPKDWKETGFESRFQEDIEIDFSVTIEALQNQPDRIFTAIQIKGDPELQKSKTRQLEELREYLTKIHGVPR
jgi:type II secretory pathway pseudopilin PulG